MSIRIVQEKLAAAGFDPGPVDGLWGRRTETALDAALAAARPSATPVTRDGPEAVVRLSIDPSLALLPPNMDSPQARLLMLAICGQEADFRHRWQVFDANRPGAMGAARGLYQFERGGGVRGVLSHSRSSALARVVCSARGVAATPEAVYGALHADDVLAGAFARLLLWTSPAPLPAVGQEEAAWQAYLREWRPGAFTNGTAAARARLRQKWTTYYTVARRTLGL